MPYGDANDPIKITQGDTRPKIRVTATQGAALSPVVLTGATVVFNMRLSSAPGTVVANRVAAVVADATAGIMEFTPTAPQTATLGDYNAEFEVTLSDGGVITFPPGASYIWIRIVDDIA